MIKTKESEMKEKIFELVKEYYQNFLKKEDKNIVKASGKMFDEKELMSIVDAALDGWWTEGSFTKRFEEKFNKFLGIKNTIVVNSGSSANLLAIMCLTSEKLGERKLNQGDEIIAIAAAFPTTVNPIVQAGCIPVFCDIDLETYNINIEHLKKAVTKKTKAVFIAHTLGNPCNLKEVTRICQENKLWLIEDSCDALGSRYDNRYTGTFGDISTFSFYPAHHITMAEGGAVCTNNQELAVIIKSMRDWGRDCVCNTGKDNACGKRFNWQLGELPYGYDHKYIYSEIGYNLKNTDINAAIGLAQLDKLNDYISIRKNNFKLLYDGLKEFEEHVYLPKQEKNSEPSWFGFPITIKEGSNIKRRDLIKFLEKNNIGTRLFFAGNIIKQPYFKNVKYRAVAQLKNTDLIMNNSFWVGVYPGITTDNISYMISRFKEFFKNKE